MTHRLIPLVALAVALPTAAFAQTFSTPVGVPIVAVEAGPSWQPQEPAGVYGRSLDSSAKGGNASQPERAVPQYGNTSGGPAY